MASLKELLAKQSAAPVKKQAAPGITIRQDTPSLPPAKPVEERQLGNTEKGQDVPFEFASEKDSEAARLWLQARQLPESSLCVLIEPGEQSSHAWIGLQNPADPGRTLFLFRLPLATNQSAGAPF